MSDCCAQKTPPPAAPKASPRAYFPILAIFFALLAATALAEILLGGFQAERAMRNFMGGFFLVFAAFKLFDLRGFAESYRGYDIPARLIPGYAFAYPFVELALGIAYLTNFRPIVTNSVTVLVMLLSSAGVLRALVRKEEIRCACLGTWIKLPMSKITLFEDLLMLVMAAAGLLAAI